MANNTLEDLNNHLFAQLERLSDETIKKEDLQKEMDRAKSINGVAKNIIDNAKTALEASKFTYKDLPGDKDLPSMLKPKKIS